MTTKDVREARVAVVWGGWSDEREISHSSAVCCRDALKEAGFDEVEMLDVADPTFPVKLTEGYDVAFVAMHGRFGEDGCIQGLLEVYHMPYTFSGVLASAVAADKNVSKTIYRHAGIPVAEDLCIHEGQEVDIPAVVERLGLPLFVKPAVNGSSYGVTKVTDAEQLDTAIATAMESCDHVLVESFIEGTEITVPVVGNDDPRVLPIVEIVTESDFYDVKTKYEPADLHHVMPARLAPETYAAAEKYAAMAHKALGCAGASRSDFIVTADGTPVILETNTIPGMTDRSLLPDSARVSGLGFPQLCLQFILWAFERAGRTEWVDGQLDD